MKKYKLVLIPFDKETLKPKDYLNLIFKNRKHFLEIPKSLDDILNYKNRKPCHLYLISDEKYNYKNIWKNIKVGEKFMLSSDVNYANNYITEILELRTLQEKAFAYEPDGYKILASTDRTLNFTILDREFLEEYIKNDISYLTESQVKKLFREFKLKRILN